MRTESEGILIFIGLLVVLVMIIRPNTQEVFVFMAGLWALFFLFLWWMRRKAKVDEEKSKEE